MYNPVPKCGGFKTKDRIFVKINTNIVQLQIIPRLYFKSEAVEVKDKVVPVPEYHVLKAYWEVEIQIHAFLTSALDGGEWSASSPLPANILLGTHWIGGWMGTRAGLGAVMKI
jgi:hypothetical protein